jgi:hypothetical protein
MYSYSRRHKPSACGSGFTLGAGQGGEEALHAFQPPGNSHRVHPPPLVDRSKGDFLGP